MEDLLTERLSKYAPRQLALDYPEAGVLVPVTDNHRNPEIIFTLRSEHMKTHRGQVAFPGGQAGSRRCFPGGNRVEGDP